MRVFVATVLVPGLDVVGPLERAQSEVTVLRRVEDLAELLAVARSGTVDVLLLAGDLSALTRSLLAEVDALPRPVGLVVVSEVSADRQTARSLGVRCLRADADPLELAAELAAAAQDARSGRTLSSSSAGTADAHRPADPDSVEIDEDGRWARPLSAEQAEDTPPVEDEPDRHRPVSEACPASEEDGGPAEAAEQDPAEDGAEAPARIDVPARAAGEQAPPSPEAPEEAAPAPPRGRITAVWGPAGAPGRTTVAVNLAGEAALQGARTLLVDADSYGPSVGVFLGLADESAGLARAVHDADRGRLSTAALRRAAVQVRVAGAELSVLTGITRPERWPELRGPAVEEVLRCAQELFDEIVVDVGFCLEEDEELSFDVPAPQRNAATLAGLRCAERILAVGGGDAVGLPRLMRGVQALAEAVPDGPSPTVVVNRVRSAASGLAPQGQIAAAWQRFGPTACPSVFLPADAAACDRALLTGQLLAEAAAQSPLRKALRDLADPPAGTESPQRSGARRSGSWLRHRGARMVSSLRPRRPAAEAPGRD